MVVVVVEGGSGSSGCWDVGVGCGRGPSSDGAVAMVSSVESKCCAGVVLVVVEVVALLVVLERVVGEGRRGGDVVVMLLLSLRSYRAIAAASAVASLASRIEVTMVAVSPTRVVSCLQSFRLCAMSVMARKVR